MDTVNERDNCELTITWRDAAGDLAVPVSASYRIDDVRSGQSIRAETALPNTSIATINLTYADNQILDPTLVEEGRRLTATAVFGTDSNGDPIQKSFEYEWQVKNLRFL